MILFKPREINVTNNPVFIIGMSPGKQRRKDCNKEVFHGNRTGDFVEQIIEIEGINNIFLTNVLNFTVGEPIKEKYIKDGLEELSDDLKRLKPYKVICLGNFAHLSVSKLVRELIFLGMQEKRLEMAIKLYVEGKITLWKAARLCDISIWRMMEIMKERIATLVKIEEVQLWRTNKGKSERFE